MAGSSSSSSPASTTTSPSPPVTNKIFIPRAGDALKTEFSEIYGGKRARARVRCGECEACTRDDCGVCPRCLKKKKFGGDGSCKGACVSRQCKNLRDRPLPKRVRASSPEQSDKPQATVKSSRRIRQITFKHQSNSYGNGDDESAEERLWPKLTRTSSQEQRGASTATRKANDVDNTSVDNQGTSEGDDSIEEAEAAPMQRRKSLPGAHRWLRRSEDHQDKPFCDPDGDEHTPYKFISSAVSAGRDLFQAGKGVLYDTSDNPDAVRSSSLAEAKPSLMSKSKTPSVKPRTRRTKPSKQLIEKNGIPHQSYLYGRVTPHQTDNICVGCLGRRSDELEHEPIIFCDACDREFHLACCEPPLEEVPAGAYFCLDCSPNGTTACLERYFERHHEERAEYDSSRAFVMYKLNEILEGSDYIPQSELSRASKYHYDAIFFSNRFIQLKSPPHNAAKANKSGKIEPVKPDFLLGKCVRLYCPIDNQYHSGRIIDWRKATHSDRFWDSEVDDVEYFVRFPAGIDYRKKQYEQWIVLEEHSLAVASTLIWGMNVQRRGILGFNPGQTWLRTSIEVLPVQSYLDKASFQIYEVGDVVKPEHKSWALASFYGEETHQLVDLKDEAVDFFSTPFAEARHRRHKLSNDVDWQVDVTSGLARVEWAEQERVRSWQKMKLKIAFHPKALTLRDEGSLDPCLLKERDPRLCRSIRVDFDRSYLLHAVVREPTRDMAGSLACELVEPSPQLMEQV